MENKLSLAIEFQLALQMKEKFCDKQGKETNAEKTGEILHKIGLVYRRRSPDKISLIKSVGLLNAAIARNPFNICQIKTDLLEVYQHVLHQAKANNKDENLVAKAKEVKIFITELRQETKKFLKDNVSIIPISARGINLQRQKRSKVSAIQFINMVISEKYKSVMADLSQFCKNVLGKPPCEYAIVGMGSLARQEITPYSDFEHIILLDDKNYNITQLEYFRWYSVIFHIVVLNMCKTIVPSLNVNSLNGGDSSLKDWYYDTITPRGISFDGMMPHACKYPLGRQQHTKNKPWKTELIKSVSEMLEYLSSESNLKNGYHLADILTKTCFVYGNKDIFEQFAQGIQTSQNSKSETDTINDITQQVKDDLNNFSTRFRLTNLQSQDKINIKQLVYRSTTIFIAALSKKYNILSKSSFDIIDELMKNSIITQASACNLKYAVAIACEMRLRVYIDKGSQCDNPVYLTQEGINEFLEIVGIASTINYFQIAYCLQCEVAKQLNLTKLYFYSEPQLINLTIGSAFGLKYLTNFSKFSQKHFWDTSSFDFDTCIKHLENEAEWNISTLSCPTTKLYFQNAGEIRSIANYLHSSKLHDEALDFYKQLLNIYEKRPKQKNRDFDIVFTKNRIAICLIYFRRFHEALDYLNQALLLKQNIS